MRDTTMDDDQLCLHCSCSGCHLHVTDDLEECQCFYVGIDPAHGHGLLQRFEISWKLLIGKPYCHAEVVLSKDAARHLIDWMAQRLLKKNEKNTSVPSEAPRV